MHDVIVIGAGPAGNIAAFKLSSMGYRVVVLDWRRNIGAKLCTGIIGKECVERFPPEQTQVYHKARAATVVSPAGKRYRIVREDTQAFIIDRVAYVDSLARRAMSAGATYNLGLRVTNIEVSAGKVTVMTSGDAGRQRYNAHMAIIASGFGSPLLSMVGLRNGEHGDYMVGSQGEVVVDNLQDTEVYLGEEIAPGSFGWLVPLSDSKALIGTVSRQKLNGQMDRFLSTLQKSGKVRDVIDGPKRWGIPLKPLRKTYADRVLVVGDAAGLVKPTTGGGIYYALLSGEMAADAAAEAFTAGDFSDNRLKGYQKKWQDIFGVELRTGYYARMLYEALGDRKIERLLRLSSESQDELINHRGFSFDWHSGVIHKAISHRYLGRLIRSFGPVVTPFLSELTGVRASRRNRAD